MRKIHGVDRGSIQERRNCKLHHVRPSIDSATVLHAPRPAYSSESFRTDHRDHGVGQPQEPCSNCGRRGHLPRDPSCPANGIKCFNCQGIGHFAGHCRKRSQRFTPSSRPSRRHAYHVEVDDEPDDVEFEDDALYAFAASGAHGAIRVNVHVGQAQATALIDSGATCNLMGVNQLVQLEENGLTVSLQPCRQALFAYGGKEPLPLAGKFTVPTTVNGVTLDTTFVVIQGEGEILLGRKSSEAFGVLTLPTAENIVYSTHEDVKAAVQRKFPEVFTGIGTLRDYEAKIHVDPAVTPVAQKPRRVPFALRDKVRAHIDDLLEKDIIERVDGPSSWVSPVVIAPKPGSDNIRLCVDMRQANTAILRERYPIPTVDEILEQLNGSTVFTKMDLKWGFHQILLEEASRDITTFAVDDGLYRYKRLMFGISCAPELYQHIIRQVLSECKGALNIADDLIVHGRDNAEHDDNLEKVLQRLREKGLTACLEKCLFRQPSVTFYGLQLSSNGVQPTKDKIEAVLDAPAPTSASEVRSFLGLVGFSARFLPHLSTNAEPLRKVTHKGAAFIWEAEQQDAFVKLKQQLAQATALAYFDKDAPTEVIADASPVGLGAVLVQEQDGKKRVVCYASRTLTNIEKRYSQTEKEALSLVWACERFHQYLFGLEFTLFTDHKPLEVIYGPKSRPSARIERWVLRLQPYKFIVKHIAGKDNIADVLSRLPTRATPDEKTSSTRCDEYVRWVASTAAPVAVTIRDIERASVQDSELSQVHSAIQSGNLEDLPAPFKMVRTELTNVGFVILRGTRIIPPQSLRGDIINLAHEGHQGIVKTKERLRSKVWWPGIDADAERKCRSCHGCQVVSQTAPTQPPVKPTPLPQGPWEHLAADLLGPLPTGEFCS